MNSLKSGKKIGIMGAAVLASIAFSGLSSADDRGVGKHLWKDRVILLFGEKDYSKELSQQKEEVEDRDLVYYQVNNAGVVKTNGDILLTEEEVKAMSAKYSKQSKEGKESSIVLIGKDGGVKRRWNTLKLEEIFALIDSMPMRQNEMRK
ncbi:DUF4174 domain-containing protein [Akkermansiaceae bacterium]|nr:DUF4174 domain-containing protein [Akkermansiaceae bacterium]